MLTVIEGLEVKLVQIIQRHQDRDEKREKERNATMKIE